MTGTTWKRKVELQWRWIELIRFDSRPDLLFGPSEEQKALAAQIYHTAKDMPLICPHTHVPVEMFADCSYSFGDPVELILWPDHYLLRMLFSLGITYQELGVMPKNGNTGGVETDRRKIWQIFVDNLKAFRLTPSGLWLRGVLEDVFGIKQELNSDTAMSIYDQIVEKLGTAEFRPRALYERFGIEMLSTTDFSTSDLSCHRQIHESGWDGRIIPTFRPDDVTNGCGSEQWRANVAKLGEVAKVYINSFFSFCEALRRQRQVFKDLGCVATDHGVFDPRTVVLDNSEIEIIFDRALKDDGITPDQEKSFTAHMLCVMAEMSIEDGLVMQLHPGSWRNHNQAMFDVFGPDKGFDIPTSTDYVGSLHALLNRYGNNPKLTLVLFTLDPSTWGRELAPLTAYPAVRLGAPWWFFDSPEATDRFLSDVVGTAGIYNLTGFVDDTRGFMGIPVRHDDWRRPCANWLAGKVLMGQIDTIAAHEVMYELAYGRAEATYKLG